MDQIKQILVDIICRAVDSCISERETESESCKPKRKRLHTGKKVQQDTEADWVKLPVFRLNFALILTILAFISS